MYFYLLSCIPDDDLGMKAKYWILIHIMTHFSIDVLMTNLIDGLNDE